MINNSFFDVYRGDKGWRLWFNRCATQLDAEFWVDRKLENADD